MDRVDCKGQVLGSFPQLNVHPWNILHCSGGLIVAKDEDQSSEGGRAPMVYVYPRTTTKRIFLYLYNMFVGRGFCWGEGTRMTAAQEVAEELGLRRAMDFVFGKGGGS